MYPDTFAFIVVGLVGIVHDFKKLLFIRILLYFLYITTLVPMGIEFPYIDCVGLFTGAYKLELTMFHWALPIVDGNTIPCPFTYDEEPSTYTELV